MRTPVRRVKARQSKAPEPIHYESDISTLSREGSSGPTTRKGTGHCTIGMSAVKFRLFLAIVIVVAAAYGAFLSRYNYDVGEFATRYDLWTGTFQANREGEWHDLNVR